MSITTAIADRLSGDVTLAGILTGGVYPFSETGVNGISPASTPAAFEDGFMKPTALVRTRTETPWGGIHDVNTPTTSYRSVVEVYVYDEGDRPEDAIESAYLRVIAILHEKFVAGAGRLKHINGLKDLRDPEMSNAICNRADFQVVHVRRS